MGVKKLEEMEGNVETTDHSSNERVMTFQRQHVSISKEQAHLWLSQKCTELSCEDFGDLESFADTTDDFELSSQIRLHIQAFIS